MDLNFKDWDPLAIACLKYAYSPLLLFMSMLDVQFPFDSYNYQASDVHRFRPKPSKALIAILERAYPSQLHGLQHDIGVRIWANANPPLAWGWHEETENLIKATLREKTIHEVSNTGVCVEDVARATLFQEPVYDLLKEIGISPGALSQGIRVALHHATRKTGTEHLTEAYVTSESYSISCLCPWIIEDLLVTGRFDGVVEVLSLPFLRSVREISLGTAKPVTSISAPVLLRDDAIVAVASGKAIQLASVGGGSVTPAIELGERVSGLAIVNASTIAVGTTDGLLSIVDMTTGRVLRSRKLPGDATTTIIARSSQDDPSETLILTIDATAVRAWTARKLRLAKIWTLPEPVPEIVHPWVFAGRRVFDALGTTTLTGLNRDMYAIFREGAARTKTRTANAVIYAPHFGPCTGVRLDGREALLCARNLTQIITVPERPEGRMLLSYELRCWGGEEVATSRGFVQTILLTTSRQLTLLLRSRGHAIDDLPDLGRTIQAIHDWR